MTKYLRLIGVPFAVLVVMFALSLASSSTVSAQSCDVTGTVDGSANPTTVLPNQTVTFQVWNFRPGENVSFWFTLPSGGVFGTASPLCCAASDGYVRFQPLTLPSAFYQIPGRWALTVQGQASQHTSVVYFCVATSVQQATSTPVPATATTAPTAAATSTTGTSPTAEASPTGGAGSPTAEVSATAVATAPAATATTEATATTVAVPTSAPFPEETATPISVGMPRTGSGPDMFGFALGFMVLMAGMLLSLGLLARRAVRVRR